MGAIVRGAVIQGEIVIEPSSMILYSWELNDLMSIIVFHNTVKPLNSGHLRVLKNWSAIKRCPLLGGRLNILSAIHGISAIWDVRYWEVSL